MNAPSGFFPRFLLAAFLLLPASAKAQVPSGTSSAVWENAACTWHFSHESRDDELIGDFFAFHGDDAVLKVCDFAVNDARAYFSAGTVRRSHLGVCQFAVDQVYPLPTRFLGKTQWGFHPPSDWFFPTVHEIFMGVPSAECPVQSDPIYVPTTSVSQGIFFSFIQFWNDIRTRADFPAGATKYMDAQFRDSTEFREFARLVGGEADSLGGLPAALKLVAVAPASRPDLNGVFYQAIFSVRGDNVTVWLVVFDLTPDDGIQLILVSRGII